jgi:hypothetical protein
VKASEIRMPDLVFGLHDFEKLILSKRKTMNIAYQIQNRNNFKLDHFWVVLIFSILSGCVTSRLLCNSVTFEKNGQNQVNSMVQLLTLSHNKEIGKSCAQEDRCSK